MNLSTDTEMISRIEDALEQIRPFLQADGGNVSFVELTQDKVVKLQLLGACKSCSMSMMTLKAGIEETIRRAVPEVKAVEAVNLSHEPSLN
jgi:Fe-S cluster biogenesis protein NfuA